MKQKFSRIIAAGVASLMLLPIFSSCGGPENYKTLSYSALDTVMTVKVSGNRAGGGRLSSDEIDEISSAVASKAAELDLALSASNKYSEIYKFEAFFLGKNKKNREDQDERILLCVADCADYPLGNTVAWS